MPEAEAIALYGGLTVIAALVALRAVHLPLWWLHFPPISESLIVLNPDVIVIALLVATPRIAALAVVFKIYAAVPLALTFRWHALLIGLALCLLSAPWWPMSSLIWVASPRAYLSSPMAAPAHGERG